MHRESKNQGGTHRQVHHGQRVLTPAPCQHRVGTIPASKKQAIFSTEPHITALTMGQRPPPPTSALAIHHDGAERQMRKRRQTAATYHRHDYDGSRQDVRALRPAEYLHVCKDRARHGRWIQQEQQWPRRESHCGTTHIIHRQLSGSAASALHSHTTLLPAHGSLHSTCSDTRRDVTSSPVTRVLNPTECRAVSNKLVGQGAMTHSIRKRP